MDAGDDDARPRLQARDDLRMRRRLVAKPHLLGSNDLLFLIHHPDQGLAILIEDRRSRQEELLDIASLPDSTVVVEFVTTTTEDGYKPRKQRYTITFRYQTKPADKEAVLGTNPFGVYPIFFSIQKSAA